MIPASSGAERQRMATALNEKERGALTHPDVVAFGQVIRDIL